jgi:hypothetical protein
MRQLLKEVRPYRTKERPPQPEQPSGEEEAREKENA